MIAAVLLLIAAPAPAEPYAFVADAGKLTTAVKAAVIADAIPAARLSDAIRVRAGKIEWHLRTLDAVQVWHEIEEAEIELSAGEMLAPGEAIAAKRGGVFVRVGTFARLRPWLKGE